MDFVLTYTTLVPRAVSYQTFQRQKANIEKICQHLLLEYVSSLDINTANAVAWSLDTQQLAPW